MQPTGCNALSGLSRSAAEEVQREARAALALLQSNVFVYCLYYVYIFIST